MERRRFTREFKLEAVRLIRDRGVSYGQASEDLKVHPTQLRNWVKAFADDLPYSTSTNRVRMPSTFSAP
jgi:transposase